MTNEELKRLDLIASVAPEMSGDLRGSLDSSIRNAREREAGGRVGVVSMRLPAIQELFALATAAQPGPLREALAEIRRLRGLVKSVERAGDTFPSGGCPACPWCGATVDDRRAEPHREDCPAFTPEGAVR